jgi:hypothetical protein
MLMALVTKEGILAFYTFLILIRLSLSYPEAGNIGEFWHSQQARAYAIKGHILNKSG